MAPTTKGRAAAAEPSASPDPAEPVDDATTIAHIEGLIEQRSVAPPDSEHPSALAAKTAAVMAEVSRVKKSGFNDAQKYAFAQEGDIADMVRMLLAKYRVAMHGSILSVERIAITSQRGTAGTEARVRMQFTLTCADTGEVEESYWEGDATDYQDKAVPKAITACKKSWLIFRFLISTGDLAEADAAGEEFTRAGTHTGQQSSRSQAPQDGPDTRLVTPGQVSRLFGLARDVPFLVDVQHGGGVDKAAVRDLCRWVLRDQTPPNPVESLKELKRFEVDIIFATMEHAAQHHDYAGQVAAAVDEWLTSMGTGTAPPTPTPDGDELPDTGYGS